MSKNASWGSVIHEINFKEQNYVNSCVAAAYQNLMANLSSLHRGLCIGRYCDIELMEYNYMNRNGYDIKNVPPPKELVISFCDNYFNNLRYSSNVVQNSITVEDLVSFGQNPHYNVGYLLWTGDSSALHAQALFVRKIEGIDYYILLNSIYQLFAADKTYFMQPCKGGIDALFKLKISNSIQGGMIATF